jgi:hypothetical protein
MPAQAPEAGTPATLNQIHSACWQQLAAAASDKAHPWRLMALATVGGGAEAPSAELRTVVLREVDAPARQLLFFTDARSPKVAQMQARPDASLLLWSAALGWQLRLRVSLAVATSGLMVSSRWARLKLSPAAQDYLSPLPPGTPLQQPEAPTRHPLEPVRATREHFAVVTATVQQTDWLALAPGGQRRAGFDADGQGRWLTP